MKTFKELIEFIKLNKEEFISQKYFDENKVSDAINLKDSNLRKYLDLNKNILLIYFYSDDNMLILYKTNVIIFNSYLGIFEFKSKNKDKLDIINEVTTVFEYIGMKVYYYGKCHSYDEKEKDFILKDKIKTNSIWTIKFDKTIIDSVSFKTNKIENKYTSINNESNNYDCFYKLTFLDTSTLKNKNRYEYKNKEILTFNF